MGEMRFENVNGQAGRSVMVSGYLEIENYMDCIPLQYDGEETNRIKEASKKWEDILKPHFSDWEYKGFSDISNEYLQEKMPKCSLCSFSKGNESVSVTVGLAELPVAGNEEDISYDYWLNYSLNSNEMKRLVDVLDSDKCRDSVAFAQYVENGDEACNFIIGRYGNEKISRVLDIMHDKGISFSLEDFYDEESNTIDRIAVLQDMNYEEYCINYGIDMSDESNGMNKVTLYLPMDSTEKFMDGLKDAVLTEAEVTNDPLLDKYIKSFHGRLYGAAKESGVLNDVLRNTKELSDKQKKLGRVLVQFLKDNNIKTAQGTDFYFNLNSENPQAHLNMLYKKATEHGFKLRHQQEKGRNV